MSLQQQCLPLPRRRKRHSNQKSNKKDSKHKETQQDLSIMDMDENEDDDAHMPTQISDLSEMDATTYLASVSAQASKLPFVFVADEHNASDNATSIGDGNCTKDQQQQQRNQDTSEAIWQGSAMSVQYLYSNRLKIEPPPSIQHIPPIVRSQKQTLEEYANTIIHDFSNLRLFLHNCLNSPTSTTAEDQNEDQEMNENGDDDDDDSLGEVIFQNNAFKKTKNASDERKVTVPPSKDSYNWHIFCLGKEEACGNVGGYYDVSDQEQNDDEDVEKSTEDGTKCYEPTNDQNQSQINSSAPSLFDVRNVPPSGYEPTTSLLCQFDQIIIRRVVNHHLHYLIQGCTMTTQRGKWIYSLLARLEKPLHRDEASSLTSLLRELCRIRSELSVEDLNGDDSDEKKRLGSMLSTQNELGLDKKPSQPKDVLAILNTLIVIIGIYFEQCNTLDAIMKVQP